MFVCTHIPWIVLLSLLLKSIPSAIWLSAYFVYSYIAFAIHRFGDLFPVTFDCVPHDLWVAPFPLHHSVVTILLPPR